MFDWVLQDFRYAARTIRRAPGFAAIALLTIAVAVGANTAIFSLVEAVLLRPLPFPDADRLVLVAQQDRVTKTSFEDATPANFLDWRARNHSLADLAAQRITRAVLAGDRPEAIDAAMVTANFFAVLRVAPAFGRAFFAADEGPGAPRVAIIGDGLWRRRFGARPDVVGETIRLNDEPTTIVGVMPPGIDYPDKAQLWVPPHFHVPDDPQLGPATDPASERGHGYFVAVGRLRAGVALAQARADMDAVASSLERDYPDDDQNVGVSLTPLRTDLVADVAPTVRLLFAAVAILLLIAVANVSALLLARATARQQEIAVRVALGAGTRRILAQLLTESVLLGLAGGACGVLLAMWLIGPLVALSPASLDVAGGVRIDTTVLAFAAAVSVGAGVLFGLAPARQLIRVDLHDQLKQSSRGSTHAGQRRVRAVLVAAEVALSVVLLVAAGLTIRSFILVQRVPTGFDVDHIAAVTVNPPPARYPTAAARADFYERLVDELRSVPGVQVAAGTSRLPLSGGNSTRGLAIHGVPPSVSAAADYRTASPDYFRAMGIPLLAGRSFADADREGRPPVVVVSASLAARYFRGRDPLGATFSIGDSPVTIVGVAGDVHGASLEAPVHPTVYVPYRQDAFPFMTFVVRGDADPASIRDAIWRVDKEQPVGAVRTMDEQLSRSLSRRRFGVTLLTAFGAVAVLLAAVGLYGVLAFLVAQRRREIGVRMALGARPTDVMADVVGQGLRLTAGGVIAGLALAAAASRLMSSLLYGVGAADLATFATVAVLLTVVAGAASVLPARRASRVDPLVALRDE